MSDNVETVDFRKKEVINDSSSKLVESSKKIVEVALIDSALDIDKKLPEVRDGERVVGDMESEEIDMFRQMSGISTQLKKDLDLYEDSVSKNLKAIIDGDRDMISAYLIKKALYEDIDKALVNRLCRNKDLYDLLRKTMFWRIQERTGEFSSVLNIRRGYKIVSTSPVHIMQVEEAAHRIKKLHALSELEKSNHPMKHIIRQMIEESDDL